MLSTEMILWFGFELTADWKCLFLLRFSKDSFDASLYSALRAGGFARDDDMFAGADDDDDDADEDDDALLDLSPKYDLMER